MIGSSQHTIHRPTHITPPIHLQPIPANASATPVDVSSAHVQANVVHEAFNAYHSAPEHLRGPSGDFVHLPFSIDSAQIDPQLLADALGLSSLNSQGGPTDGGQMHPPNVPLTDSSLFRSSSDRPLDQSATGAHLLEEDSRDRERVASFD